MRVKDIIACALGRHKYLCLDMVPKRIAEDENKVRFSVKSRCVKCGKVRMDFLDIPKWGSDGR